MTSWFRRMGQNLGLIYRDDGSWRPGGSKPPAAVRAAGASGPLVNAIDLIDFLHARIDEDETVAQAAVQSTERSDVAGWYWTNAGECVCLDETAIVLVSGWESSRPTGAHIVRWDPERVLAECNAKRRMIQHCSGSSAAIPAAPIRRSPLPATADADLLRLLALPYDEHSDFRPEWRT